MSDTKSNMNEDKKCRKCGLPLSDTDNVYIDCKGDREWWYHETCYIKDQCPTPKKLKTIKR